MRDGYIMDFNPCPWLKISKKARWSIEKARKMGVTIRNGTLDELRRVHWEPSYLPFVKESNQHIFSAYVGETLISSILVIREGDHLIYKYAGTNPDYKEYQGNSILLWWVWEVFKWDLNYLDLGGSRKPNIESFKRQFATRTYNKVNPRTRWKRLKYRLHQLEYLVREKLR